MAALKTFRRAGAISLLLIVLIIGIAEAHTALVSSFPARDAVVPYAPFTVRLVFGEPVDAALSTITIAPDKDSAQKLVVRGDPHDVHAILADASPTRNGAYVLHWHVVSADGHPVSGSYGFFVAERTQVQAADTATPIVASSRTPSELPLRTAMLRAAASFFVLATAGLLAFISWLSPLERDAAGFRRARGRPAWLALLALLFCFCHAWSWGLYATGGAGASANIAAWSALTGSAGKAELARVILCALTVWALVLVRSTRVAVVPAIGAVLATAAIGHAAAISPGLLIPIKAVHLIATSLWLGGLIILVSRHSGDADDLTEYTRITLRVSIIALTSVILIAITGIAQTLLVIKPAELISSSYGLLALGKAGVLIILIGLGAANKFRNVPALERGAAATALKRVVGWEIAMIVVAFVLAGALAYTAPPEAPMDMSHSTHMETGSQP